MRSNCGKSVILISFNVCVTFIHIIYFTDCQRPNFEAKDRKPYNYYRIINDPNQVKPDNITQDNLFAWLNLKNSVRFKLWTRQNPHLAHEIKYKNFETLRTSNFDPGRVTKILIHGYADTATEMAVTYYLFHMRDAYLAMSDVNVIVVDYSLFMIPIFYWTSNPTIGALRLAEFLQFMVEHGELNLDAVHMVGFSMGAHVAGIAGHRLKGAVGRITGLDPAGPTFQYVNNVDRLDKSDAQFVDIIHTNGGKRLFFGGQLGLALPLGHVDVYPNGGTKQIGCPATTPLVYETLECSHGRSARLFIESITSPLAFPLSCPCDDFDKYIRSECHCNDTDYMSFMGEHMPHTTRGIYYLVTRAAKPFGHGPLINVTLLDVVTNAPNPITSKNLLGKLENHFNFENDGNHVFGGNKRQVVKAGVSTVNVFQITYKNVTTKTVLDDTFQVTKYPNDAVMYACLEFFLKVDKQLAEKGTENSEKLK